MKKILLFIIMLFSSILVVDATSISNIDMDIFVDNYGNAIVTETWDVNVTSGTEGYHPYYNLGNSIISDLEVSMDGQKFTTIDNWNVNGNFYDKSYKASILYVEDDEVDICFGISSYGSHKYLIKYKISNFVATIEDADMLYWNLFPYGFSVEPSNVNITIHSNFKYDDSLGVYGYGKYGAPCFVAEGKIKMTSDNKRVTKAEYMTILVKFPKGTFQTSNILSHDFSYYLNMAEEGAINYNDKMSFWDIIKENLIKSTPLVFIIFCIIIFSPFGLTKIVFPISNIVKGLKIKVNNANIKKNVSIFREVPCNGDLIYAYWLLNSYKFKVKNEDLFSSILLKWSLNNNVKFDNISNVKKSKIGNIVLLKRPSDKLKMECILYDYLYQASVDGNLDEIEFHKWCDNDFKKLLGWFSDLYFFETIHLMKEGKIHLKKDKNMLTFNIKYFDFEPSVEIEADRLFGLKKFLNEFTLISERKPIEVKLWKDYLIFAQLFGIADKVAIQFEKFYPEIVDKMDYFEFQHSNINFINEVSLNSLIYANKAMGLYKKSSSINQASDYGTSGFGGGGFSSGGGGTGSFGSGSGGGGFR